MVTTPSVPLGVTLAVEKDSPTEDASTKVDVDPQAGWIDISRPEEVQWTKVMRLKDQKKAAHSSLSSAV